MDGAMGRALAVRECMRRVFLALSLAACVLCFATGCAGRISGAADATDTTDTANAVDAADAVDATDATGTPLSVQPHKLRVVATIFPQYDFARQIAGDLAEVKMLLPPGVESHTFEPTPADMLTVINADVFLYTGDAMEPWAARVLVGADSETLRVVDVTRGIALDEDDQGVGDALADAASDSEHSADGQHEHEADAHVWLDPTLAAAMVSNVTDALCEADPANEAAYRENADAYIAQLELLDSEFTAAASAGKRDTLVFGGKFAYHYFLSRYHLHHVSAYDSCSTEAEPGMRRIAQVMEFMRDQGTPVIYHEELADPKVARAIAEETGARLLQFATAHTVSREQLESGASYLSIMRANLENVKAGLE